MTTSSPSISNGCWSATPIRRPTSDARASPAPGSSSANSSPPSRATSPCSPTASCRRGPSECQQLIAGVMAERVVELLEAVEVDHRDRERRVAAVELLGEPLVEQPAVREPGQLVGQRQLAGRMQRRVLVERQRHPDEHEHERGRRQEDGGVDRRSKWSATSRRAGDEREQRRRDEHPPALERDRARRAVRAPRGGGDQQRREQAEHRHPQRAALVGEPGRHVADVGDDMREQAERRAASRRG